MQRTDSGRQSKDEQDVKDVRAYHVANGYCRLSLTGGNNARGQFGQRCAAGNHGQSDDSLADAQCVGQTGGMADKDVAAQHKEGKTHHDKEHARPRVLLLLLLRGGFRLSLLRLPEGVHHEDGKARQQHDAIQAP